MLGSAAAGENRGVVTFGLRQVPGCKAEEVPGTRIDLALLAGSLPASWSGGGCSCLGSGEPSDDQTFPLQEGGFIPVPLQMGSEENAERSSEGERVRAASPSLHGPSKQRRESRVLTRTLRAVPAATRHPREGCRRQLTPPAKRVPPPPQSQCRGPGTAEPALTESDDRLHLQHGVSQAGVPPLDQALLVRHRPVQILRPVLGDKEL